MAGHAGQFDSRALTAALSKLGWDHGDFAAAVHDIEARAAGHPSTLPFSTDTAASWTAGDRRPGLFYGARAWIAMDDAARRVGQRLTPEAIGFNHLASRPKFWDVVSELKRRLGEPPEQAQSGPGPRVTAPPRTATLPPVGGPDEGGRAGAAEAETFFLTYGILSPNTDPSVIDTVEASTYRLGRLYARTQPAAMLLRVQEQLRAVSTVLDGGLHLADHARALTAAGWQCLLLAMLHYDLGQYEAGQASRDAATYLGREVGDKNLLGWTYETAAWFAIYEGAPQDVVEAAEAGRDTSPEKSPARVMNVLKLGVGLARFGRQREAEQTIEEARNLAAVIPTPRHPDYQFAFDEAKLDLYVARIYALLRMPAQAERAARSVIDQTVARDVAKNPYPVPPTRESFGRLDLASALLDRGELEEACDQAKRAFGAILRHDVLNRAGEVHARLRSLAPTHQAVREYHERYREARQTLAEA